MITLHPDKLFAGLRGAIGLSALIENQILLPEQR